MGRRFFELPGGEYRISVGTPIPKVVVGSASKERVRSDDLANRLRSVATDLECMSEPEETRGMVTYTMTVPIEARPRGPEYEALIGLTSALNTVDDFSTLDITWSSFKRGGRLADEGISPFFDRFNAVSPIRHLRVPSLHPVIKYVGGPHQGLYRLPSVVSIVVTGPSKEKDKLVAKVAECLKLSPGLRHLCLRGGLKHCTCWDAFPEGDIMRSRRRAARAAKVTALNILTAADYAPALPPELWRMVWDYVSGDGLSMAQVARAVELGWGDDAVATIGKRAAAMGHLEGDEFNAAVDEWLEFEGFGMPEM
ncbi:hypothetical protein Q8F55_000152 [Vanrija albida]|uniref:Uncharacterized protein n=1 Tax=Vanrija albida TaxID=181172 RepID=A0ABR3QCL3_9TREE